MGKTCDIFKHEKRKAEKYNKTHTENRDTGLKFIVTDLAPQ